jgi:predicted DNA-binding antitoxin AbrB/MazE fold protein
MMSTTIKAVFSGGVLKPLEKLPLREGSEVSLTIQICDAAYTAEEARAILGRTAGAWSGEENYWNDFLRYVYEARIRNTRPPAKL